MCLLLDPGQHVVQLGALRNCLAARLISKDELRLAAAAVQWRHRHSSGVGGDRGTVVALHHVQAQVEAGRRARRRQHLALVDVEHVGVEVHGREAGAEQIGSDPVCRRALSVEQPGGRQRERAGAVRRDPGAAGMGRRQRGQHVIAGADGDVVAARHDHGVRVGQGVDAVVGGDAEWARGDHGLGSAHQKPVSRLPRRQLNSPEHLDRCAQVERDGVGKRQDGDGVHGATITASVAISRR